MCQSGTTCDLCKPPYYLYSSPNFSPDQCVLSCPKYSYTDASGYGYCAPICPNPLFPVGNACIHCASNCGICTSLTDCVECDSGYFLYQGVCGATCPAGYYGDSSSKSCQPCDSNCLTCTGAGATSCILCNTAIGAYPLEDLPSTCVTDCEAAGYYQVGALCKSTSVS